MLVTGDVGVRVSRALHGSLGEEGHGEGDDAEHDEGVEQVVLDGVPPWPEGENLLSNANVSLGG